MKTNEGNTTSNPPIITRSMNWSIGSVRAACVRNDLYTLGDNDEYSAMLEKVNNTPSPTDFDIWMVGKDIAEHSEHQTVTNVMYILANSAIRYTFELDGRDDI